jgi:hypothetical protein
MIPANRFPHLSNLVPEFMGAEAFVADTVHAHGFEGLIGTVFYSKDQFMKALDEGHWHVPASLTCKDYKKCQVSDGVAHVTYHAELTDKNTGAKWWFLLQGWYDNYLLVCNVVKTKEGSVQETPTQDAQNA